MRGVAVALLVVVACNDKKQEPPPRPNELTAEPPRAAVPVPTPEPVRPVEPAKPVEPPKPFAIERLKLTTGTVEAIVEDVDRVLKETAPELVMMKFTASYVRKDGTIDPVYGKLEVELQTTDSVDGIVDDPNRPTGAPVPDAPRAEKLRDRCPAVRLDKGTWTVRETGCYKVKLKLGPKCTVAQIWTRALAAGAPDNALALIDLDRRRSSWNFKVTDKLRGVDFHRYFEDECSPKPPKPNPYKDDGPPPPTKGKPNPFDAR